MCHFFLLGVVKFDLELVYFYVRVDFGHVFVRPSEAIVVLLEELNEGKAWFRAEACPNLNFVI